MSRLFTEPSYRAFSTTKEAAYGTAELVANAKRFKFQGEATRPKSLIVGTDENERTGKLYRMEHSIKRWGVDVKHERRLLPHEFALFLSLLLGSTTPAQQGATAAYKHVIIPDDTTADLLSATMWEKTPVLGEKKFPGIFCSELSLEWGRDDPFVHLSVSLGGDGSMVSGDDISATDEPVDGNYMMFGDMDILFGGTFSGTAVSSGVSKKALIRSGKLTIKNGGERIWQMGDSDGYAGAALKGNLKADDFARLALNFEPADSTELDYFTDETEAVIELKFSGDEIASPYNYECNVIMPVGRIVDDALASDKSVQLADLEISAIKDDSGNDYPILYCWAQNRQTAYLG